MWVMILWLLGRSNKLIGVHLGEHGMHRSQAEDGFLVYLQYYHSRFQTTGKAQPPLRRTVLSTVGPGICS
jgi:hypothetical protein